MSAAAPARSTAFDVIAIGSSAGGVTALGLLLSGFAGDLPVPLLVVQHLDPRHETVIAEVLQRRTRLRVKLAEDGERAAPGIVYVAPPDRHLLVREGGVLTLTESELVHFVRPSADLLFESVAATFGDRAIACVLTGTGVDGSMGVTAVSDRSGTVIVEDPGTAEFPGMPEAAAATGAADFVLPLDEIASVLDGLVRQRRA
ncbi:chemotaxis protein CheB [Nocardioides sp. NPDC059952]|uniref:chemotaxis protein CheB n=1 Tax=Nocardioides sp. NPDC059952 TaxID=3347014 RepID=UPI00364FBA7E